MTPFALVYKSLSGSHDETMNNVRNQSRSK